MSILKRWPFTKRMIDDAPDRAGVYVLWDNDSPLGIGHALGGADTVQSRLLKHFEHARDAGMDHVTHYSWEISFQPTNRQAQLADELQLPPLEPGEA